MEGIQKKITKTNSSEHAITLIALVVTIVVLLILAGVSISMLTGDNGIIKQAQESKENTRGASAKEELDLWKTNNKIDDLTYSTTAESKDDLLKRLVDKGTLTEQEAKDLDDGKTITIGKSEISLGETPTLPMPENAVISQIKGEYESIDEGIVIYIMKDADGDGTIDTPDWTNPEKMRTTYDQFVWVPVPNAVLDLSNNATAISTEENIKAAVQNEINAGRYPMAIKKDAINYIGVLYEFSLDGTTNTVRIEPYSNWTPLCENDTNYREPAYLEDSNFADASDYNNVGITKSSLQEEYNAMVNKVKINKGFWVGRYETSNMNGGSSYKDNSKDSTQRIEVVKGATDGVSGDYINWYRMYVQQKNYSNKANITLTSGMIWGSQWDQIMIWMKNVKNEAKIHII